MAAARPAGAWPGRAMPPPGGRVQRQGHHRPLRAVPTPRATFTISPTAAACPGGIAVMIAVLLAGIGAQADAGQTQPGRYHHIRGGDRQRGGAAGSQQPAVQAATPVRPAGGQDSLAGYGGQHRHIDQRRTRRLRAAAGRARILPRSRPASWSRPAVSVPADRCPGGWCDDGSAAARTSPPATGAHHKAERLRAGLHRRPAGALVVPGATLLACSVAAPPTLTTRTATGTGSAGASPHAADVNSTNPCRYTSLRPYRSGEVRLR